MNPNVEKLLQAVMAAQRLTRPEAAKWLESNVPVALDHAHKLDGIEHQEKLAALAMGRA